MKAETLERVYIYIYIYIHTHTYSLVNKKIKITKDSNKNLLIYRFLLLSFCDLNKTKK